VERPHRAGGLGDLGDQTGLAVRRVAQEKMKVLVEPGLNTQEDSLDAVGLELFAPAPAVRLPAGRRETDEVVDRRVNRVQPDSLRIHVRQGLDPPAIKTAGLRRLLRGRRGGAAAGEGRQGGEGQEEGAGGAAPSKG